MKIDKTEFGPISESEIATIAENLKGKISDPELNDFVTYTKSREGLTNRALDDIYVIVRVTVTGDGTVESTSCDCSVDQKDWSAYEDEPDMAIDPVSIPLTCLLPAGSIPVSGTSSFIAVFRSETNLWDCCKDLPSWVWDSREFEFMLSVDLELGNGDTVSGAGDYASALITF